MDKDEQKALQDIEEFGCHVLQIMAEGNLPPFSYSIGIQKQTGKPELVVIGLKEPLARYLVNEYNSRVRGGEEFIPGQFYSGFLEGFDCTFEPVDSSHFEEYFGWGRWLYGGNTFEVLQLIYPTTTGQWPWSPDASPGFVSWQPILTETGRSRFTA